MLTVMLAARRAFVLALLGAALVKADDVMTPIYTDNIEFLSDRSNIVSISLPALQQGLSAPNLSDSATFDGPDWTQSIQSAGSSNQIHGFTAHLRTAFDVPVPEDNVENSTTAVTSLTFSLPTSLQGKTMSQDWYICRHIFISTAVSANAVDHSCGGLGEQCLNALRSTAISQFGEYPDSQCAIYSYDAIPSECVGVFGFARADTVAFDQSVMNDPTQAAIVFSDDQVADDWRIGTGFHAPGSQGPYEAAANRTYLIMHTWGWSTQAVARPNPAVSFTCLRGTTSNGTTPGNSTTSSAISSSSTAFVSSTTVAISSTTSAVSSPVTSSTSTPTGPVFAPGNDEFSLQGCYAEPSSGHALPTRYANDSMTVEMCLSHATGSAYAGIEYGRECWYGNTLGTGTAQDTNLADCDSLCPGNALEYCGSGGHLVLYKSSKTPPSSGPTQPQTVGGYTWYSCMTEATTGHALADGKLTGDDMTLEKCATFCQAYKYFGVEYARECYCGNTFGAGSVSAPSTDCKSACVGNAAELCGAGKRLSAYSK